MAPNLVQPSEDGITPLLMMYPEYIEIDTTHHNNKKDALLEIDVESHFHPHIRYRLDSMEVVAWGSGGPVMPFDIPYPTWEGYDYNIPYMPSSYPYDMNPKDYRNPQWSGLTPDSLKWDSDKYIEIDSGAFIDTLGPYFKIRTKPRTSWE